MSIYFSYQTPIKLKHVKRIKQLLNDIAALEGYMISSLSIVFTSDEYLLNINQNYLNHDYYTDIITFDYTSKPRGRIIEGELYISKDRASENSSTLAIPINIELLRLMIHGLLHLCGYTDDSLDNKATMTSKENEYLSLF